MRSIFVGRDQHVEPSAFKGPHYVECYIVKDGVCVAAAHVPVPHPLLALIGRAASWYQHLSLAFI